MKYFAVLLACLYVANAGAVSVANKTVTGVDAEKLQTIRTLENDITILDAEILKCEKSKKGWIAATVIGSAGVVATGVAAGVQGAQIGKKKTELATHNEDITQKQQQLQTLQAQQ